MDAETHQVSFTSATTISILISHPQSSPLDGVCSSGVLGYKPGKSNVQEDLEMYTGSEALD